MVNFIDQTIRIIRNLNLQEQRKFFDQSKEKLIREFKNFYFDQAYRQAHAMSDVILINSAFDRKQLLRILEDMTFEEFVNIGRDWMRTGRMVWFINGNIAKDVSIQIVERAREAFNLKPVEKEDLCEVRAVALNPRYRYLI